MEGLERQDFSTQFCALLDKLSAEVAATREFTYNHAKITGPEMRGRLDRFKSIMNTLLTTMHSDMCLDWLTYSVGTSVVQPVIEEPHSDELLARIVSLESTVRTVWERIADLQADVQSLLDITLP